MRRYLVASILGIMIGQYVTLAVVGNPESELKLNHEFSPFMATEPLTTEYRYTLLFSDTERKIYFIQSLPEKPKRYPVHNMLGIYYGKGNLSDLEFVPNKTSLTPYETTPLSMVYPFYPPGCDMEIQDNYTTSRECSIHILSGETYPVLYLDQRFSAGGTGGHHDGIARKYLIVTSEHILMTNTYHVITYFSLGYPRDSGRRDTWRAGYMGYSHCYDITVSLKDEALLVTCKKQTFQMENLFDTPEMVEHSVDKAPHGWWGESFTFTHFHVPREPIYQYQQEMKTFPLKVIE